MALEFHRGVRWQAQGAGGFDPHVYFTPSLRAGAKQSRDNSPRAFRLDRQGRQGGLAMTAMCVRTSRALY